MTDFQQNINDFFLFSSVVRNSLSKYSARNLKIHKWEINLKETYFYISKITRMGLIFMNCFLDNLAFLIQANMGALKFSSSGEEL